MYLTSVLIRGIMSIINRGYMNYMDEKFLSSLFYYLDVYITEEYQKRFSDTFHIQTQLTHFISHTQVGYKFLAVMKIRGTADRSNFKILDIDINPLDFIQAYDNEQLFQKLKNAIDWDLVAEEMKHHTIKQINEYPENEIYNKDEYSVHKFYTLPQIRNLGFLFKNCLRTLNEVSIVSCNFYTLSYKDDKVALFNASTGEIKGPCNQAVSPELVDRIHSILKELEIPFVAQYPFDIPGPSPRGDTILQIGLDPAPQAPQGLNPRSRVYTLLEEMLRRNRP